MADTQTASTSQPSGSLPPDMLDSSGINLITGPATTGTPPPGIASLPQSYFDPVTASLPQLPAAPAPAAAPAPTPPAPTPLPAAPQVVVHEPPGGARPVPPQAPASAPPTQLVPPARPAAAPASAVETPKPAAPLAQSPSAASRAVLPNNDQPLAAGGFSYSQIHQLAVNAGFQGQAADTISAIVLAESSGDPNQINRADPGGSFGLTQINAQAHGDEYARRALDPQTALNEAYAVSKGGTDFSPWSTYTTNDPSRSYQRFMIGGTSMPITASTLPGYQEWKAASDERKQILQQEITALQTSMSKMEAGSPQQRALADQLLQKQLQLMDKYEEMIAHPPTQKPRDMISNFGSLATLIGIFAGRFANRPMVASLNAAGAAMEAMNNNDRQAYTDAFNQWKVQTDMTSNLLGMESNVYKGIMEDRRLDLDEKFKMLEMQMKIFDNAQGIAAAQMGDYEKMWQVAQQVQDAHEKLLLTNAQIREANDRADEAEQKKAMQTAITQAADGDDQAWLAAHPEAKGILPSGVHIDNLARRQAQITEKATPQAAGEREVDQAVQAMDQKWLAEHPDAKGVVDPAVHWQNYLKAKTQLSQTQPSVLRASNNPNAIALQKFMEENPTTTAKDVQEFIQRMHPGRSGPAMAVSKYLEEHPEATSAEIANYYATLMAGVTAERYWSTGDGAKTVRSIGVSIDHLAVADDLSHALNNGDSRWLNSLKNTLATQFGATAVPNFDTAKQIVGAEVSKAIIGGAGTGGERETLQKNFDASSTPEQLLGVIQTLKRLMAGQLDGQRRQYMTSTGRDDFEDRPWLSDEAKRELNALSPGGGGAARPADGAPQPDTKGPYRQGQEIWKGGKRYRATSSDPTNPDVEPW